MIKYVVLILILSVLFFTVGKEPFVESPIPLKIFQTWYTKDLPIHMKRNCDRLQRENPQFEYFLYDDADCLKFIQDHFQENVVNAFRRLIPGAYKADLWRCCVMYIHGGIYLDIKMRCVGDFRLIELTKKEHYVLDRASPSFLPNHIGIYNAVMIHKPKNPLMMDCIVEIVKNVENQEYGFSPLYPTGPGLLGDLYLKKKNLYHLSEIDLIHEEKGERISLRNRTILEHYPEYRREQVLHQNDSHYSILWKKESIYLL
jgi:mannosyltransferase OCH1-like enzyme